MFVYFDISHCKQNRVSSVDTVTTSRLDSRAILGYESRFVYNRMEINFLIPDVPYVSRMFVPPHPGAGIAIKGDTWVSGWYPTATELTVLKKAYSSQKKQLVFRRF